MAVPKSGEVEFSALVPAAEYEKFKANFPAYGSVKWFVNESLAAFNRQVEANPSVKQLIERAVSEMVGAAV